MLLLMESGQIEAAAACASVAVASAALLFARGANARAKDAIKEAENANRIAQGALAEAKVANQLAKDANMLSEEANATSERTMIQQGEAWLVDWHVEWQQKDVAVELVNTGGDIAHDLTIVVESENLHQVRDGIGDVAPGEKVEITLAQVADERAAHAKQEQARHAAPNPAGVAIVRARRHYQRPVNLTIRWHTGGGRQVTAKRELVLT